MARKNKFLKVDAPKGSVSFVSGVEGKGTHWEDMTIAGSPAWLTWMTEFERQLTDPTYIDAMLAETNPTRRAELTWERARAAKEAYHDFLRLPREQRAEKLRAMEETLIAKARELAAIRERIRAIRTAV